MAKLDPFLEMGDGEPGTAECFYCDNNEEFGSGCLEDHEPWCLWRRIVQTIEEPIDEDTPPTFNPPRFKTPQGGGKKKGPATAPKKVKVTIGADKNIKIRYEPVNHGSIDDDDAGERRCARPILEDRIARRVVE